MRDTKLRSLLEESADPLAFMESLARAKEPLVEMRCSGEEDQYRLTSAGRAAMTGILMARGTLGVTPEMADAARVGNIGTFLPEIAAAARAEISELHTLPDPTEELTGLGITVEKLIVLMAMLQHHCEACASKQ